MEIKSREHLLLGLSYFPYFGSSSLRKLEQKFSSLNEVLAASEEDLLIAGLSQKIARLFLSWKRLFSLSGIMDELARENISYLSWHDALYPEALLKISQPPPILFYQGDVGVLANPLPVAIVGSRNNTAYALESTQFLIPPLLAAGCSIISGLALGVDSLAHRQAIKAGGQTVAVIGSGLSTKSLYPRQNSGLAREIINGGGLLLSEFPPSAPALKNNFPRRNRIISGLARVVVVIEAEKKSGSLITVNHALEQGREVMAVPGSIFSPNSEGTNELIQSGAAPALGAADILGALGVKEKTRILSSGLPRKQLPNFSSDTEKILYLAILEEKKLGNQIDVDKLTLITKLDTATINSTLSILEINGLVTEEAGLFSISS